MLLRLLLVVAALPAGVARRGRKGGGKKAEELHRRGAQLLGERRLEEALDSLNRAVQAGNAGPETYELRSKAFGMMRRWGEALADLDIALGMGVADPPQQHFMRGVVLQQLDRKREATASVVAAVGLFKGSAAPQEMLVSLCQMMLEVADELPAGGDERRLHMEQSVEHCQAAIAAAESGLAAGEGGRTSHNLKTAYRNAGLILLGLGQMAEAREHTDHSTNLIATHKPLAAELEAVAGSGPALAAPGKLHALWPIVDGPAADGPASRPFHVVSAVLGSAPAKEPWHTPVWVSEAAGSLAVAEMNAMLVELVHEQRAADPGGVTISNHGGWQSGRTTVDGRRTEHASFIQEGTARPGDGGSAVRLLYAHILRQVGEYLREVIPPSLAAGACSMPPEGVGCGVRCARVCVCACVRVCACVWWWWGCSSPFARLQIKLGAEHGVPFISLRESWANVNQKGHQNNWHSHALNTLAGCYYVTSGYAIDKGHRTALQFMAPQGSATTGSATTAPAAWSTEAFGRAGVVALWPGYLNHSVAPHEVRTTAARRQPMLWPPAAGGDSPLCQGAGERISIAFNIALTLKK